MASGPGYWLDLHDGTLHRVSTHDDWLLDPENQQKVRLAEGQVEALTSFDRVTEIDQIRMVGLLAGLVRIRDYRTRVSVQFLVPTANVREVLDAVQKVLPRVTSDECPFLTIQNLYDDSVSHIYLPDLRQRLQDNEAVLEEQAAIPSNDGLRREVQERLGRATGSHLSS